MARLALPITCGIRAVSGTGRSVSCDFTGADSRLAAFARPCRTTLPRRRPKNEFTTQSGPPSFCAQNKPEADTVVVGQEHGLRTWTMASPNIDTVYNWLVVSTPEKY